jgi:hypothetical protein
VDNARAASKSGKDDVNDNRRLQVTATSIDQTQPAIGPALSGPGIHEPVAQALSTVLRRAVLEHVLRERRRVHPPSLHVGWPGGPEEVFTPQPDDALDHTLRSDIIATMLRTVRRQAPAARAVPMLWLIRPGPLAVTDVDQAWLAAAISATGEAGVGLTMVSVNRHGWLDPRTGVRREWRRLRNRQLSPASGHPGQVWGGTAPASRPSTRSASQ